MCRKALVLKNKIILLLLAASLPMAIQAIYEMTVLTIERGEQMVLFSIFHGAGGIWGGIVVISYFAYWANALVSFAYGLLAILSASFRKNIHVPIFVFNIGMLLVVFVLGKTYPSWIIFGENT